MLRAELKKKKPHKGRGEFSISLPLIGTDFTSENSDLKAKQNKTKTFVGFFSECGNQKVQDYFRGLFQRVLLV